MSENMDLDLEQRLRSTFRAVAELPPGAPALAARRQRSGRTVRARPLHRHRGFVAIAVSVAAVAAVVSLLVVYGPHNTRGPARHPAFPGNGPATSTSPTPRRTVAPTIPTTAPTTRATVPAVSSGTRQIAYQAYVGSQVNPSLHVTGQQSGACFKYGGGAEERDYYRCGTMQPCFAGPEGTGSPLVCPQGVVTADDIVIWNATSVDTNVVPATTRTPWAMQLSNGGVCTLVNAAWSGLGPFACADARFADCHEPHAGTPLWTAQCQTQVTATSTFTSTTVEKVWF